MVVINLLPWRKHLHKYQRKSLIKILLLTFLLHALWFYTLYFTLSYKIRNLEKNDHALQKIIKKIEQKTQAEGFSQKLAWSKTMQDAHNYSQRTVKTLRFIGLLNRNRSCFRIISRKHHKLKFVGDAYSMTDLTAFLNTWQDSKLFSKIVIENVEQQANATIRFKLTAREKM